MILTTLVRRIGGSMYFRLPIEVVHGLDLKDRDIAITEYTATGDKIIVTLKQAPAPQKSLQEIGLELLAE